MSKAMPTNIKKNLIYRKVYNEVWENDSNASFIIIGKPGLGKSTTALKMCEDMDASFNVGRICFNVKQFLDLLSKGDTITDEEGNIKTRHLSPGSCIIFDEIVTDEGAESRSALSKSNKLMNYINATYRAKRLIVFYCLPSLMQLDKNLRDINITGVFQVMQKDTKTKLNSLKFFWQNYDAKNQKVYYTYPRLIDKSGQVFKVSNVWIGMPSSELNNAYKERKMYYLQKNIDRWKDQLEKQDKKTERKEKPKYNEIIEKVFRDKEKYIFNGIISPFKIMDDYDLSLSTANRVVGYLNKQLSAENQKNI